MARSERFGAWAFAALAMLLQIASAPASAAEWTIAMRTEGSAGRFVFEPDFLHVAVGDRVTFVTEHSMYDTKAIAGMTPEGASMWWSDAGSQITIAFDRPGVYGYKCAGYYENGMVGLILVGDSAPNLEEAQSVRHPAAAAVRFERLLREARCAVDRC